MQVPDNMLLAVVASKTKHASLPFGGGRGYPVLDIEFTYDDDDLSDKYNLLVLDANGKLIWVDGNTVTCGMQPTSAVIMQPPQVPQKILDLNRLK